MSVFRELNRRNVFRVAIAYLAFAWLLTEVTSTLFPAFGIPDWAFRLVVILLALGFLPTLFLSWAYEITPEGLRREKDVARYAADEKVTAKRLDWITIALVIAAFTFVAVDRLWLQEAPSATSESAETISPATSPEVQQPAEAAATPGASLNSIAVLPFANRSAKPEDVFFVDGIHDDLLTFIAQIGTLKTISRTSVMQYRDSTKPIPQIAKELGVATVLEGGVQRAGEQVRINVQLIDAATDVHLWSEIYDRDLTAANLFAIQSEIAGEIADALRETLTPQARKRIDTVPTENLAALEEYFLGRQRMALRTPESLDEAVAHFETAVELDPAFALAWVGLADSARLSGGYGGSLTWEEALVLSGIAVDRALALNPDLGEAHVANANLQYAHDRVAAAEVAFRRGIELNPNYASAYQWYGEMLGQQSGPGMRGRMAEALELSRKAVELDPFSPIINNDYGEVLERAGRPEEALAYYRKAVEIEPRFAVGHARMAALYPRSLGRIAEAVLELRAHERLQPSVDWIMATWRAWLYLHLGDTQHAAQWHERALEAAPEGVLPDIAYEWRIYQGEYEAALEVIEQNEGSSGISWQWPLELHTHLLIRMDRVNEARTLFTESHPGLFDPDGPTVEGASSAPATAALILSRTGEPEAAERLARTALDAMASIRRMGPDGRQIFDARLHAVLGDTEAALAALAEAVDDGWREGWWYYLEHDPVLEPLHDAPRYQAIKATIEADMARQREALSEHDRQH